MNALTLREALDQNAIVGVQKVGPRRFWTGAEVKIVRLNYPVGGVNACLPLLPGRSTSSIYQRAGLLGLHASDKGKRGIPRERWTVSPAIDAVIQRAYQRTPTKGDLQRLAQTVGRPRWWVSKRASALGLVTPRFKSPPWTEAEDEIITSRAHQSPESLSRRLRGLGYQRTATAVTVRLKRLGATTEDPDHYTAHGLAKLFGIDQHAVTAWIAKGWLKAKRRGTERVAPQGGDQWWIHRRDVRAFIIDNAAAVDLRKVDRFWFIDLLATPRGVALGRHDEDAPSNEKHQNPLAGAA